MIPLTAPQPNVALLVDDDLDLLELLIAALVEEADFEVLTAAVSDLVVPVVEADLPAVVVLDLAQPSSRGWKVLAALRQQSRFRTLPVLVVSALPGAKAQVADLADSLGGVPGATSGPGDAAHAGAGLSDASSAGRTPRRCS